MNGSRDRIIIKTSVIGIIANVFLAVFKAVVGVLVHSIAVVMDAVNNLSDALSSLITIIGTKMASKEPDREHPFGHGRVEYLSAMVIAIIILYAGVTSLIASVRKIAHPQTPDYSAASLVIIAAAVVVKILLGRYVTRVGKKVDSDALIGSGTDATFDAVISASTLAAAAVFLTTGVKLEAWLGAVISLVIIKAGVDLLRATTSEILGERVDPDVAKRVKECINAYDEVSGTCDLVVHNYGPRRLVGSVHIEVPDTMTADELDSLERTITQDVYIKTGVAMTGISIYSVNEESETVAQARQKVSDIAGQYRDVLDMHGFYMNEEKRVMKYDLVIGFDAKDRMAVCREIEQKTREMFPDYRISVTMDADISD